jgi:hypothetical protein
MRRHLAFILSLPALLFVPSLLPGAETGIVVREPWIREAPPPARVLAAYMVIDNPGAAPARISRITSPDFRHTELHRTRVEGGVAGMEPVAALHIAAGESLALMPGGLHLMLFDPLRPLHAGDSATLVIHDDAGGHVTVEAPVVREAGDGAHHDHHH